MPRPGIVARSPDVIYTSSHMTAAPIHTTRTSSLSRAAVLLYAVAQLFIALATVTEGRFGADARAHVETAGTSAHHAHDEAGCAACAARALLWAIDGTERVRIPARPREFAVASRTDAHPDVATLASTRPRAPPLRQA